MLALRSPGVSINYNLLDSYCLSRIMLIGIENALHLSFTYEEAGQRSEFEGSRLQNENSGEQKARAI
jgi:hypothetical protein